jgi:non-heme Fe2+,alpha-ketoglutarate-dependent halogenase
MSKLSKLEGEVTVDFEPDPARLVEVPLKKGELVLFFERTMHGSGANRTDRGRVGVSCRVTHADTIVYPERMQGNYIDGMNLNIRDHKCVHLCGDYRNPQNVYLDAASPASPAKRSRSDESARRSA